MRTSMATNGVLGAVGLLFAIICAGCQIGPVFWQEDTWLSPSEDFPVCAENTGSISSRVRHWEVCPARLQEAITQLEDRSYVGITTELAQRYTGEPIGPAARDRSFYLIRGVRVEGARPNSMAVFEGEALLRVTHVKMGGVISFPETMIRQPVVAELEHPPKDVYVSVDLAI